MIRHPRYVVQNNPRAAIHYDPDCRALDGHAVDEVRAFDHDHRTHCRLCYGGTCEYCGERFTLAHECETRVHCGACDEPTLLDHDREHAPGTLFQCGACEALNIVPTPGVADG